ncbi:hypothetical protein pb186bvf_002898 [Paramecium bursaria]
MNQEDELRQRRQEKILQRSGEQRQPEQQVEDEIPKWKILKEIEANQGKQSKQRILLAIIFGITCGILNIHHKLRYLIIWGTFMLCLILYNNSIQSKLHKKMQSEELLQQVQLLGNQKLLKMIKLGESGLHLLKSMRGVLEAVIVFNVVFILTVQFLNL